MFLETGAERKEEEAEPGLVPSPEVDRQDQRAQFTSKRVFPGFQNPTEGRLETNAGVG